MVVYDEFMAVRDKKSAAPYQDTEYLELISSTEFQPPMASVDDPSVGLKGTRARPQVVMTVSNEAYWNDVTVNVDAFHRRRDVVVLARLSSFGQKHYNTTTHNLDLSAVIREEPEAYDTLQWMTFQLTDTKGGNPGKAMSYARLVDTLRVMKADHDELASALIKEETYRPKRSFQTEYEKSVRSLLNRVPMPTDDPMVKETLDRIEEATGDSPISDDESEGTVVEVNPQRGVEELGLLIESGPVTHEGRAETTNRVRRLFKDLQVFAMEHLGWGALAALFLSIVCLVGAIWRHLRPAWGDSKEPDIFRNPRKSIKVPPPDSAWGDGAGVVELRGIVGLSWDGHLWQQGIGTHDRYVVLNYHFFLQEVDGEPELRKRGVLHVRRGEKVVKVEYDPVNLACWREADLARYHINDVKMQAFKDIRRKFLAARDFDTSQRIHARVRLVGGDKQVVAKYEEVVAYMAVGETFELGALTYAGTFAGGDCGSPVIATSGTAAGKILGVHVASYKHTRKSGMATLIFQEHLATDDVVEVAMGDFAYSGANVKKEEKSIAPGGDNKSRITESALKGSLTRAGFPDIFSPAVVSRSDERWRSHPLSEVFPGPLEKNVARTAEVVLPKVQIDMSQVVDTMADVYGEEVEGLGERLTIEEAVFGIPGILDPIDKDASPGWPLTKVCGRDGRKALIDFDIRR